MVFSSHDAGSDLLTDNYETKFSKEIFFSQYFFPWAAHLLGNGIAILRWLPLCRGQVAKLHPSHLFKFWMHGPWCSGKFSPFWVAKSSVLQQIHLPTCLIPAEPKEEGRILRKKDFGEQCQSSSSFVARATSVFAGTAGNNIMLAWIEIHHMLSFAFVHSSGAGCCRDHWRKSLNTVYCFTLPFLVSQVVSFSLRVVNREFTMFLVGLLFFL